MSLILSGSDGLSDIDGSASTPAIRGTDANTGIFFPAADTIAFAEGGAEAMRITSDGNVGIGTTSPAGKLHVYGAISTAYSASATDGQPQAATIIADNNNGTGNSFAQLLFKHSNVSDDSVSRIVSINTATDSQLAFVTENAGTPGEALRINGVGNVGIGYTDPRGRLYVGTADLSSGSTDASNGINLKQTSTTAATGIYLERSGERKGYYIYVGAGNDALAFQRNNAGTKADTMLLDRDGNVLVGTTNTNPAENNVAGTAIGPDGRLFISAMANEAMRINRGTNDGTLVFFHQAGTAEGSISVSGTTVSYNGGNLSRWAQMLSKPDLLKGTVMSNLDEMNVYTDAEGNPVENEQLNKVKVSDVEGDVNVAGVFVNWTYDEAHQVDEINMAMTGDMIIRIAQGVVVQKGDLLMSAGDGTAKPQGDDIVRSKTVAKVTSNHVTCTYADGSYCVPCVLMAC
jgi:hypothetical protein